MNWAQSEEREEGGCGAGLRMCFPFGYAAAVVLVTVWCNQSAACCRLSRRVTFYHSVSDCTQG